MLDFQCQRLQNDTRGFQCLNGPLSLPKCLYAVQILHRKSRKYYNINPPRLECNINEASLSPFPLCSFSPSPEFSSWRWPLPSPGYHVRFRSGYWILLKCNSYLKILVGALKQAVLGNCKAFSNCRFLLVIQTSVFHLY